MANGAMPRRKVRLVPGIDSAEDPAALEVLRGGPVPPLLFFRAKRLWRGHVHRSLRSPVEFLVGWVVGRCARILPLLRKGHVSGASDVSVGRLRALRIELSTLTPLQSNPPRSLCLGGCNRDPVPLTSNDGKSDVAPSLIRRAPLGAARRASFMPGVPSATPNWMWPPRCTGA